MGSRVIVSLILASLMGSRVIVSIILASLLSISISSNVQQALADAFPGVNGKIAFSNDFGGHIQVYVMNADGSERTNISNDDTVSGEPSWSPDGSKIAYVAGGQITIMNADGSGKKALDNAGSALGLTWSPDGTQIAFSRLLHPSPAEYPSAIIQIINLDGTGLVTLTDHLYYNYSRDPSWSPDGTKIAFEGWAVRPDGYAHDQIMVVNVDGTGLKVLSNSSLDEQNPSWSPDGKKIAYNVWRYDTTGASSIYIMNADGTEPVEITAYPKDGMDPSWSPDGTKIVFSTLRDSCCWHIYIMNTDGSDQTLLSDPHAWMDMEPSFGAQSFLLIPESPIGTIALMASLFAALGAFVVTRTSFPARFKNLT